ncbi:alpha/beta-hydrolase [Pholiota conissans]|uniref:Alpha/beta-hydrolase n=1 Tax=Pholiota conissans TaxID=109636 RepID=A0A9P6D4R8_9AGAR|nr:alpha/beta-hydrolase [Pholiota conissans]
MPSSITIPPKELTPYKIAVPHEEIHALKQKLALTTLPNEVEGAGRDYGVPLEDIGRLLTRWKFDYDWAEHEKKLNEELPQFQTKIEVGGFGTLNIHFVHKQSKVDGAIPLLFVHGWPGGFFEIRKILPLLTEAKPDQPSFHVVALSLPGFGFSEAPKKIGFGTEQYAEVANKLMLALGYEEYVTQGGDLGYAITRRIASTYGKEHSKAWHTNWQEAPEGGPPCPYKSPLTYLRYLFTPYTAAERAGLERTEWFKKQESGYFTQQSTRPITLGYSLADSPVGLLAWIYEKLVNWTDGYKWDDDEVLTWVSLYWFSTAGPAASINIYYERAHEKGTYSAPTIPQGVSYFPKELVVLPRSWLQTTHLAFENHHEVGGHFAAYEEPELLASDLRKMFGKTGPVYGIVQGHSGY